MIATTISRTLFHNMKDGIHVDATPISKLLFSSVQKLMVFVLCFSWFPGFTYTTISISNTDTELDFPEQLTADNISFSYTLNARLFAHVDVVISWEKPEGRIPCL